MADREWILLNPGPANTTATVRAALVMPDLVTASRSASR
jgi:hypothetical protein